MTELTIALSHLEDAEAALMSHMARFMGAEEDEELPDSFTMMMAVLRSVSRAAGVVENTANSQGKDSPDV